MATKSKFGPEPQKPPPGTGEWYRPGTPSQSRGPAAGASLGAKSGGATPSPPKPPPVAV